MSMYNELYDLSIAKDWSKNIISKILLLKSLVHYFFIKTSSWNCDSKLIRVRQKNKIEWLTRELEVTKEIQRINIERYDKIPPKQRLYYTPELRFQILKLKCAFGWNNKKTAQLFNITPETVSYWMSQIKNVNSKLLQLPEPINKFSDFVRSTVKDLKISFPSIGKLKIANILCRLGVMISPTTVDRIIKSDDKDDSDLQKKQEKIKPEQKNHKPDNPQKDSKSKPQKGVISKYPDHVWHIDFSIIPISGLFNLLCKFSFFQIWPFCWRKVAVVDQFTRRVISFHLFKKNPSERSLVRFLANTVKKYGKTPKHMISDQGSQFTGKRYKNFCKKNNIKFRFGAVGKYGSISYIERFFRTLKTDCIRKLLFVPMNYTEMYNELNDYIYWYNNHNPHQGIKGLTPIEKFQEYNNCYKKPPPIDISKKTNLPFTVDISFYKNKKHLPVFKINKAA